MQAAIVTLPKSGWQLPPLQLCLLAALLLSLAACSGPGTSGPAEKKAAEQPPVRLLVVDDPALAEQIERQWSARSAGTLQVSETSGDKLLATTPWQADVVIFPSRLLGSLAEERRIEPLPKSIFQHPDFAPEDVYPLQRLRETHWGVSPYAVTFGSPQWVMYYRTDVWENAGVTLPATWQEYQAALEQLRAKIGSAAQNSAAQNSAAQNSAAQNSEAKGAPEEEDTPEEEGSPDDHGASEYAAAGGPPEYVLAEPLAEGWAVYTLLARVAAYVKHSGQYSDLFNYSTMEPRIASEPFVRALTELVAAAQLAPPDVLDADPEQIKTWFYQGRIACGWSWPDQAFDIGQVPGQQIDVQAVGLAELPGSPDVYNLDEQRWDRRDERDSPRVPLLGISGRLGAVTREATSRTAAAGVLAWLSGREWGATIGSASPATASFRTTHLDGSLWVDRGLPSPTADGYCRLVEDTQHHNQSLLVLRIPGYQQYLAALDQAVRAAVAGTASPQEALTQAAQQWDRITDQLGRDAQQAAYARHLGLE